MFLNARPVFKCVPEEADLSEEERSVVREAAEARPARASRRSGRGRDQKHLSRPGRYGGPLTLCCFLERKSTATLMKFDHKFPQGPSN